MSRCTADDPPGTGDPPVLVYGTGETGLSILAAALARRQQRPFGWIQCATSEAGLAPAGRRRLEEGSAGHREVVQDPRDLGVPEPQIRPLSQFFLDEPVTLSFEVRLAAYLGMPVLLQRMASQILSGDGRSMIVLTNLDALPLQVAVEGMDRPEVQSTLRREGVSVVATYRGTPPDRLKRTFRSIYRVQAKPGRPWSHARVTFEEGPHPTCGDPPVDTLGAWVAFLQREGAVLESPSPRLNRRRPQRPKSGR
jgi:hypothetical protein